MGLANFIRRSLGAAARRDKEDRFKALLLAGAWAFGVGGQPRSSVSETARRQAVVKLVRYAFPSWDTPIAVMGRQAEGFAEAIRAAGYERCAASETAQDLAIPADGKPETIGESPIVVMVEFLERLSVEELAKSAAQVFKLAPARIAASISTYPEDLWGIYEGERQPVILERRNWWDEWFRRNGFDAEQPPRETLAGLSPFLYRRRHTGIAGTRSPETRRNEDRQIMPVITRFLMPERQNAFRWVTESLASALTDLGHPAEAVSADAANPPCRQPVPHKIGWAHYWPQYRDLAKSANPAYEVFVTNFEMKPRGSLTPWVAEMCARASIKLVASRFCGEVLASLGVPDDRIRLVPHGYSPEFVNPAAPLPLATRKSFRFLAVVNSHDPYRYGTDILLKAYRKAFRRNDDVCLVIKDYGADARATQSWFDDSGGPEILYYANFLEKSELAAFYAACSAFVAPFRGEGFGMKILDAAVAGLPLIVPLYGGPLDYCVPELVQPVAFERRPVGKCLDTDQIEWREEITWCEPGADDLAARLRWVFENRAVAGETAFRLRDITLEQFSWEAAARKLIAILEC